MAALFGAPLVLLVSCVVAEHGDWGDLSYYDSDAALSASLLPYSGALTNWLSSMVDNRISTPSGGLDSNSNHHYEGRASDNYHDTAAAVDLLPVAAGDHGTSYYNDDDGTGVDHHPRLDTHHSEAASLAASGHEGRSSAMNMMRLAPNLGADFDDHHDGLGGAASAIDPAVVGHESPVDGGTTSNAAVDRDHQYSHGVLLGGHDFDDDQPTIGTTTATTTSSGDDSDAASSTMVEFFDLPVVKAAIADGVIETSTRQTDASRLLFGENGRHVPSELRKAFNVLLREFKDHDSLLPCFKEWNWAGSRGIHPCARFLDDVESNSDTTTSSLMDDHGHAAAVTLTKEYGLLFCDCIRSAPHPTCANVVTAITVIGPLIVRMLESVLASHRSENDEIASLFDPHVELRILELLNRFIGAQDECVAEHGLGNKAYGDHLNALMFPNGNGRPRGSASQVTPHHFLCHAPTLVLSLLLHTTRP